ncbi:MAG: DEAD/DEAH box helicase [Candidatus Omnitrophica bacterium]|nr:DEAD/DEAH box helicase [Candidatus Omnitrophota bacterium]
MPKLIDYIRRLDSHTLESLAGTTIVRAVREVFDINDEFELAKLVTEKYGINALNHSELKRAIFDTFDTNISCEFCRMLGLKVPDGQYPQVCLQKYFTQGYSKKKSSELVSLLDLPQEYIRTVVFDDREATEIVNPSAGRMTPLRGFLHPYQKRIKDEIIDKISKRIPRVMVQMPTGSGKTVTALEAAIDIYRQPFYKGFIVWLVDSNELAEQALESFKSLWILKGDQPLKVHRLFGGFSPSFDRETGGFVFASFSTLWSVLSDTSHANFAKVRGLIKSTDLLIVDEAHTSIAETYEQVIRKFVDDGIARLIGLSATPARNDLLLTQDLARLYSNQLIQVTNENREMIVDVIKYLQDYGVLADIKFVELESGSTFDDEQENTICRSLAEDSKRNELILKQIELADQMKEQTLIFSCTLDHVYALIAMCRAKKINAEYIIGETPQSERIRILDRFRKSETKILINLDILSTGVDLPNVNRLIVTRPVGSPILFSQILGRALRGPRNGGNSLNTLVTIKDNLINYPNANFVYRFFTAGFISAK